MYILIIEGLAMFAIRYKNTSDGPYTTLHLHPGPTEVDYPEKRLFSTKNSQDGNVIIQRPMKDHRPRRWIWRGYRSYMPVYAAQWKRLEELEYQTRLENGKYPYVEIFEDVTDKGGFGRRDESDNPVFTQVKIIQVDRELRDGGGPVTYDTSYIEFVITDPDYREF